MTPEVALTIAGSDSGGGAGIQADLRAFAANGVFGTSAITAVTAQNTLGVDDVHVVPAAMVTAQIDAVLSDLPVRAVKTGMLATAELVELVAERAATGDLPNLVVDPVLVSATGHRLLEDAAIDVYRERLLPRAKILTPNLLEAEVLLDREVSSSEQARQAAQDLLRFGPEVVVVKGGHADGMQSIDLVATPEGLHEMVADRIPTSNDHGTGCTFAAATAAGLATGADPLDALDAAKQYVTRCIAGSASWKLGGGHGPLDHLELTNR